MIRCGAGVAQSGYALDFRGLIPGKGSVQTGSGATQPPIQLLAELKQDSGSLCIRIIYIFILILVYIYVQYIQRLYILDILVYKLLFGSTASINN
jgi:hypothetical protein